MIGPVLIVAYLGFAFWCAATRPRLAVLAMVFLAPWGALYMDIGLSVYANQIMMLALLVCTLARSLRPGWHYRPVAASRFLALFILYVLTDSLVQLARLPDVGLHTSVLRGPTMRGMVQMFMFVFTVSPVFMVTWWMRGPRDLTAMARTYVVSALVLAALGWLQLLIWYKSGTNPMPVDFFNTWLGGKTALREGIVPFGNYAIYRMNSFSGEPRSLGGALVFAMLIIQAIAATSDAVSPRKLFAIWMFLAISTLATLSTTALLVWFIGSVVMFPTARLFGTKLRVSSSRILILLVVIITPFAIGTAALEASGFPIIDLMASRTIERIDTSGAVEDLDLAIINYFKAHPSDSIFGVGLGNAHVYAQRYIDPEFQWYALGNVFTAKTQYLRLISESGFVGLALGLLWYLALLINAAPAVRVLPQLATLIPIATMAVVVFLATGQVAAEFYLISGALSALTLMARQRR